jgi:hypothetical protein
MIGDGAGVVAMASCTGGAEQGWPDTITECAAQGARGQRQDLADVIGAFACKGAGELLDLGVGQFGEATRFRAVQSRLAANGDRVVKEGDAE